MNTLRRKFESFGILDNRTILDSALKGIKPAIFYSFSDLARVPEKNLAEWIHIHPRTMNNYRVQRKTLEPVVSEHLLQLISLYLKGEEIFGNVDQFNQWLKKPFWNNSVRPIDWLVTPGGVQLVADELTRLAHGYAA